MPSSYQNDTFGELTPAEHARLREQALTCTECGQLATVDPVFHQDRYQHAPRIRTEGGTATWDGGSMTWQQDGPEAAAARAEAEAELGG